jgi:hypothetical protein
VRTLIAFLLLASAAQGGNVKLTVVQAPDTPVRLERAKILNAAADEPRVLYYAATNLTDDQLEQFTVMAFIFNAEGRLKAKQIAPGRRTLDARSTKFSTMVLDGEPIEATDQVVVGINQAQKVSGGTWWRAELQPSAEEAVKKKP